MTVYPYPPTYITRITTLSFYPSILPSFITDGPSSNPLSEFESAVTSAPARAPAI
eukprot:CAMPEP_0181382156 /NCGR_PEP_ID=MMETSP1106-20121128/20568_1 /TAXON_ID=81844 /ORGANISM="Mantoniella antarctica, Strain SL-175" /LENGTH=54 /DNA_ID=CAMNT_0023501515 /DNA_START=240 /DNA_END=401 /DNA_ORIENTATION=+